MISSWATKISQTAQLETEQMFTWIQSTTITIVKKKKKTIKRPHISLLKLILYKVRFHIKLLIINIIK